MAFEATVAPHPCALRRGRFAASLSASGCGPGSGSAVSGQRQRSAVAVRGQRSRSAALPYDGLSLTVVCARTASTVSSMYATEWSGCSSAIAKVLQTPPLSLRSWPFIP